MNNKSKVLIIGYGVVGQNIHKLFPQASMFDPYRVGNKADLQRYYWDYGIVCVPTDGNKDGSADTSVVEDVINEWKECVKFFVIKSTIPPGTTNYLSAKLGVRMVFSPEYYGATQHANTPHEFAIFGGKKEDTEQACQLWQEATTGYSRLLQTDAITAELVKYAENSWLAMQVTFCNEFYRICKQLGVSYPEFRELLLLDERISRSHTFVYDKQPYYDSHCLNKDLPALVARMKKEGFEAKFIEAIIQRNEQFKGKIVS